MVPNDICIKGLCFGQDFSHKTRRKALEAMCLPAGPSRLVGRDKTETEKLLLPTLAFRRGKKEILQSSTDTA